jgi:16S rRNA (guanine527-N7)-methyltransferase
MELPAWTDRIVSRETIVDLRKYEQSIQKWSPTINLISKNDLKKVVERHILDSLQICLTDYVKDNKKWLDIGSGGGFPAIVVSIVAKHMDSKLSVICVEADSRKAAFLRVVAEELSLNLMVIN